MKRFDVPLCAGKITCAVVIDNSRIVSENPVEARSDEMLVAGVRSRVGY